EGAVLVEVEDDRRLIVFEALAGSREAPYRVVRREVVVAVELEFRLAVGAVRHGPLRAFAADGGRTLAVASELAGLLLALTLLGRLVRIRIADVQRAAARGGAFAHVAQIEVRLDARISTRAVGRRAVANGFDRSAACGDDAGAVDELDAVVL